MKDDRNGATEEKSWKKESLGKSKKMMHLLNLEPISHAYLSSSCSTYHMHCQRGINNEFPPPTAATDTPDPKDLISKNKMLKGDRRWDMRKETRLPAGWGRPDCAVAAKLSHIHSQGDSYHPQEATRPLEAFPFHHRAFTACHRDDPPSCCPSFPYSNQHGLLWPSMAFYPLWASATPERWDTP
jgi:hypothetical protein